MKAWTEVNIYRVFAERKRGGSKSREESGAATGVRESTDYVWRGGFGKREIRFEIKQPRRRDERDTKLDRRY